MTRVKIRTDSEKKCEKVSATDCNGQKPLSSQCRLRSDCSCRRVCTVCFLVKCCKLFSDCPNGLNELSQYRHKLLEL